MRDNAARLVDIHLACRELLEITAGVDRPAYEASRVLQLALCRSLEVIGEAARTVTEDYRAAHPEVPWTELIGLRNRIVHEYFRLDLDVIWRIVSEDIPALAEKIATLVPSEDTA